MNQNRRILSAVLTAGLLASMLPGLAQAQQFPNKPIKWIVGSTAGSGMDILARIVSDAMSKDLGQPILIDNRAGAAGAIAATALASSPADGYTILHVDMGTYSLNPHLYKKPGYDPLKDFTMTGMMVTMPMVLAVSSSLNVNTVGEFVSYVKAKPQGTVNFASSGTGNPTHMTMELFQRQAGIKMTHVPYRGSPLAVTDIATGQVAAMFLDPNTPAPFVQSGKLRILTTASPERVASIPNVPTIKEAGYDVSLPVWVGIAVPHGTPPAVVDRLNASLNLAMQNPQVTKKLNDAGFQVGERWSAKQTDDFARADYQQSAKNLTPLNLKLD